MRFLDFDGLNYFTTKLMEKLPSIIREIINDIGFNKVNSSTTNGNILLDNVETKVYTLPNATTSILGGVKTGTNVSVSNGTISVANGSTSTKGVVQLTDSTSSTSTTTAATPNSVKSAYDLANNAKTIADGKANSSHTHTVANISDLTATATELNYVDGVTSNIQTQLNGKAATSHGTHVTYSTTTPAMNGTANVGTANTVSRGDHIHPVDTSRAAKSDFDSHIGNTTTHITATERTNWNAAKTHADSTHAPSNAEKNQNAFSNVKVGDVTVAADITTDTLTLIAGNNVTITPDATNDTVTIAATNTVYTHPTTSGNKHIPSGGSSGQILRWASDGTAAWGADNNTTYTLSSFGVTATADELNYCDGVTSNIQTQLNEKAASSHTHNYAGSSSPGGAATSALSASNADTLDGYHADSFAKLSGANFTGQVTIVNNELNGTYNGLLIGDDCYIGDCNATNTIGLMGSTNNNIAYIKFGKNGGSLGYNGSNLVYNNSMVYTGQNITYGTNSLTPGTSSLATGYIYLQYE